MEKKKDLRMRGGQGETEAKSLGRGQGVRRKEEKEGSMGWKAEKKTGRRRGRENTWRVEEGPWGTES